jgi:hypothetical protein
MGKRKCVRCNNSEECSTPGECPGQTIPCGCFTGDWASVLPGQPRDTCPRCGGWRPVYG